MDIPWEDVQLFLAVAEGGSVSAAARALRLGQPTVSRRLAALEHAVGAALFRRSVTGTALTAAGERLVAPARKMAEWAGEVGRTLRKGSAAPEGLVRVAASPYVAFEFLAPFAAEVAKRYPGLRLEVSSGVQYVDLLRGEADLALRPKPATGDDLTTVCSFPHRNAVYVSASLAATLPRRPTLADVPWIAWSPPFDSLPPNPQLAALLPGVAPAFTTDNFLVQLAAAEAGLGAVVLARADTAGARRRKLVPLDLDLGPHNAGVIHLVCAKSALDISRVRAVAGMLEAMLARSSGAGAQTTKPQQRPVKRASSRR